jgi:hypothetical protein
MVYRGTDMIRIVEVVRRCQYCGSDMTDSVSSIGYAQNPFCAGCLDERVSRARRAPENETAELIGRYFHFTQESQKAG